MLYAAKTVLLHDRTPVCFRNPRPSDAKALLFFLKACHGETDFLIRYPEEWAQSEESEAAYLASSNTSAHTLTLLCLADGEIAGICTLQGNTSQKLRHRATLSLLVRRADWGRGIGHAMLEELADAAKQQGISQLELDYIEGNYRAAQLFAHFGFVPVGEKPDAIRLKDGTLLKEFSMIKKL